MAVLASEELQVSASAPLDSRWGVRSQVWAQTPIAASDIDWVHGRITTRTIQVLPAPMDLSFPHVNQVWLIGRYVTDTNGKQLSAVAALGVTNLATERATRQRLASLVRNHWGIESLHWPLCLPWLHRAGVLVSTPKV